MVNWVPLTMPLKSYCSICLASLLSFTLVMARMVQWGNRWFLIPLWWDLCYECPNSLTHEMVLSHCPTYSVTCPFSACVWTPVRLQLCSVTTNHAHFHSRPLPLESPSVHSHLSTLQEHYVSSGQRLGRPRIQYTDWNITQAPQIFFESNKIDKKRNVVNGEEDGHSTSWCQNMLLFYLVTPAPSTYKLHVALNVSPYHFLLLFRAICSCFLLNQKLRRSQGTNVQMSPAPLFPWAPLETVLLEKKDNYVEYMREMTEKGNY